MTERLIIDEILVDASDNGSRLFRQNVGLGWAGTARKITKRETVTVNPGDVVIRKARPLRAGLTTGSGDVIGITPVVITPDMVGQTIGVFTSVEVKDGSTRTTKDQDRWRLMVQAMGGIAMIVKSVQEYRGKIASWAE